MDDQENPLDSNAEINERREMPRLIVDAPATVVFIHKGTMMLSQMTELSLGGCRLVFPKTLTHSIYSAVECTFKIQGVGFRLGGIIEWVERTQAGIQFSTMSARSRDALAEVLSEVELKNNAQAPEVTSPAEIPASAAAVDSQAIETIFAYAASRNTPQSNSRTEAWNPFAEMGGGIVPMAPSLLKPVALRPQTSPDRVIHAPGRGIALVTDSNRASVASPPPAVQPAATPAPQAAGAAGPSAQQNQPNRGRDRRATHRCGVDTSAIIDLVKVGSKIAGQIVDLSLGGCRIKTIEKFPVGIYTRIETEFKVHGLAFRLGGVIQAIHNSNTVGIRFLDMSQRKRNQVEELIAEIDESQPG